MEDPQADSVDHRKKCQGAAADEGLCLHRFKGLIYGLKVFFRQFS